MWSAVQNGWAGLLQYRGPCRGLVGWFLNLFEEPVGQGGLCHGEGFCQRAVSFTMRSVVRFHVKTDL